MKFVKSILSILIVSLLLSMFTITGFAEEENEIDRYFIITDKATTMLIDGKYQEAIELFDEAIQINPTISVAYNEKANALSAMNKYTEAITVLDDALLKGADSYHILNKKVELLSYMGREKDAEDIINKLIKEKPEELDLYITRADLHRVQVLYDEAIADLNYVIAKNKGQRYLEAYYHKSNILLKQGKIDEAINVYDEILKIDSNKYSNLLEKGDILADTGRFDEAIKCFDQAIALEPDTFYAFKSKVTTLSNEGKYLDAVKILQKAIDDNLNNPKNASDLYEHLGEIYIDNNKYNEAIKAFDSAIMYVNNEGVQCEKLSLLIKLKKCDEAQQLVDKLIRLNPNSEFVNSLWVDLLIAQKKYNDAVKLIDTALKSQAIEISAIERKADIYYFNLGKTKEAIALFDEAISNNPYNHSLYCSKAKLLYKTEKYEEAIKVLDKSIELRTCYEELITQKGVYLTKQKKYAEAIKVFDRSIKVNAINSSAYYEKGITLKLMGKNADALKCFDRAIMYKPNYRYIYFEKSGSLISLKKYNDALICLNKAISMDSNYAEAYYSRACVYAYLKKNDDAITDLEKAVTIEKSYIIKARQDVAFSGIRKTKAFTSIVK